MASQAAGSTQLPGPREWVRRYHLMDKRSLAHNRAVRPKAVAFNTLARRNVAKRAHEMVQRRMRQRGDLLQRDIEAALVSGALRDPDYVPTLPRDPKYVAHGMGKRWSTKYVDRYANNRDRPMSFAEARHLNPNAEALGRTMPKVAGLGAYHPYQVEKPSSTPLLDRIERREARRAGRHWLHPDALGVRPGRVSWADMHNRTPYVAPNPYYVVGERDLLGELIGPGTRVPSKIGYLRSRDKRRSLEGLIPGRLRRRAVGVIERFRQKTIQARAKQVARSALKAKVADALKKMPAYAAIMHPPLKRRPLPQTARSKFLSTRARGPGTVAGDGAYFNVKSPWSTDKPSFVRDWLPYVGPAALAAATLPWTGAAALSSMGGLGTFLSGYAKRRIADAPDRAMDALVNAGVAQAARYSHLPEGEERANAILAQLDAEARAEQDSAWVDRLRANPTLALADVLPQPVDESMGAVSSREALPPNFPFYDDVPRARSRPRSTAPMRARRENVGRSPGARQRVTDAVTAADAAAPRLGYAQRVPTGHTYSPSSSYVRNSLYNMRASMGHL